ncbi:MAG: hypothetical protein Q9169_004965 [Polycauliona sp. 2 TL-2023]
MAVPWSKSPTQTIRGTEVWSPKLLSAPPPTWTNYLPQHDAAHGAAVNDAALTFKCPPEHFVRWRWVVRIYSRNLALGPAVPNTLLNPGVKLKSAWTQATAWFVRDAHAAGAPAQYLLTAAHNFLNPVYAHDDEGNIASMGGPWERARADAIFVVATLGPNVFTGWVDRISVMRGYFDNVQDVRNDGAALRIAYSTIPPDFYLSAPRIASLPAPLPLGGAPPVAPHTWNLPFVVAGYPGAINGFADLAGFYIGGVRNVGAVTATVGDFAAVTITKNIVAAQLGVNNVTNATITWNSAQVVSNQGMSGCPQVLRVPGAGPAPPEEVAVSSLNVSGIGAGFANPPINANQLSVDPLSLLFAVNALDLEWFVWTAPGVPAGTDTWWALRRIAGR